MPNIPFLNPSVLKQLDLPVPSRDTTPQVLEPLNLNRPYAPTVDIQAYRQLYGFDSLECEHWQGYVQMPLFKLHVQVFQPKLEAGKLEKAKVRCFYCMAIWSTAAFISRLSKKFWSRALVS